MNAFLSSEIRWFYRDEGSRSAPYFDWFIHLPDVISEQQSTRIDYYYRLAESPRFGIKLRMEGGGKAETKEQIKDYGAVRYDPQVEGLVNDWIKWSFTLNEPAVDAASLTPSWLAVEKERWLQKYAIEYGADGQPQVIAIAGRDFPPSGFGLEFTRIRISDRQWFSIGFEAYDQLGRCRQNLDAGVRSILARGQAPAFGLQDSLSYYGWLAKVTTGHFGLV